MESEKEEVSLHFQMVQSNILKKWYKMKTKNQNNFYFISYFFKIINFFIYIIIDLTDNLRTDLVMVKEYILSQMVTFMRANGIYYISN